MTTTRLTCWVGVALLLGGCGTRWDGPEADSIELSVKVHKELLERIAELRTAGATGAPGDVPEFLQWSQLGYAARVRNTGEQPLMIEVTRFSPESTDLEFRRCQMRSQSSGFGKLSFPPGGSHDYGNAPFDTGVECGEGKDAPLEFRVYDMSDRLIWISETAIQDMLSLSPAATRQVLSRLRPNGSFSD